jgi:hypothetical protein
MINKMKKENEKENDASRIFFTGGGSELLGMVPTKT